MSDLKDIRIVLVEPSHPGNIGGAARAMKTMGLSDLVVINPRRFPDPQADWRAAGALDVLDQARVVERLDDALTGVHWIVGTSTRSRRIPWPVADAKGIAELIVAREPGIKVAILFGREDNGLTNEELQRCNHHLQIPAAPVYSSLNLAMAVQVVCYELFQTMALKTGAAEADLTGPGQGWDRAAATAEQVEGMLAHIETVLREAEFLDPTNPGQTMTRLRRLFSRVALDETEVAILRGVFKHLNPSRQISDAGRGGES